MLNRQAPVYHTFLGKPESARWAVSLLVPRFCHDLAPGAPLRAKDGNPGGVHDLTRASEVLSARPGSCQPRRLGPRPLSKPTKACRHYDHNLKACMEPSPV